MKRLSNFLLVLMLLMGVSACAKAQPTWQEQYDLGVRYLSEGNYEEAIIAFTAAIEIDPKQALAYVGRGDAYMASGETEENLTAAQADYEKAIELDERNVDAYVGLANLYIRRGEYDKALEILNQGLEKTNSNQIIADRIEDVKLKSSYNKYGATEFIRRQGYREFTALTTEQQTAIVEMCEVAQSGDYKAMMEIAQENVDGAGAGSLTIWNGYKIEYSFPYSLTGEFDSHSCGITIRPENGIGYSLYVSYHTDTKDGSYLCDIDIASCPCVDWQWNGKFIGERISQYISKDPNHEMYDKQTETGEVVNGLRNGEFHRTNYWRSDYEDNSRWNDHEDKESTVDVYKSGVCIQRGEDATEDNYITIWNGSIGGQSMEDQWMKDIVYW